MQELTAVSTNYMLAFQDEGAAIPIAEVILIIAEPSYRFDAVGGFTKERIAVTTRFCANAATLRMTAQQLLNAADVMEKNLSTPAAPEKGPPCPTE